MDWKEYEEVTKYIYEALGRKDGVTIVGYGNNCRVRGESGVEHQIDVLTSYSDGTHKYQAAIECKFWKKKIDKEVVMKMANIIEDTGISTGVIVSKKGYTKDGMLFAKYKNIGLVVLGEVDKERQRKEQREPSFKILELEINSTIEVRRPEVISIEIDGRKSEGINPYQMIMKLKTGIEIPFNHYLADFQEEVHKKKPGGIVHKHYEFDGATLINRVTKEATQISEIKFIGKLTIVNKGSKQVMELVDEVWMTMKKLFENDSFIISKTGLIKKGED